MTNIQQELKTEIVEITRAWGVVVAPKITSTGYAVLFIDSDGCWTVHITTTGAGYVEHMYGDNQAAAELAFAEVK